MSSENNKNLEGSLNSFADVLRAEINNAAQNVETGLGKRLGDIDSEISSIDKQLDSLRRDLGSVKNDVAVGNGQLRKFTIPKKEGIIRFFAGGQEIEARVDSKGNVSGKHVSTSDILANQVEVTLDTAIDKDTTVSFLQGNVNDAIKTIQENIKSIKGLQLTQDETFINIQKSFEESINSVKTKVSETLDSYKSEFTKMNERSNQIDQKLDRLSKKLLGVGTILKDEGTKL